jgi:hypothetical protein
MQEETLEGHNGRPVAIDVCTPCQSFWFDARESLSLTPRSTLTLFRVIGERTARAQAPASRTAKCPRCSGRLRATHDMQRATRFEYLNCPHGHGRLTTFFDFLKEKDFIRPLSAAQIAELRNSLDAVNCSNCGAPIDLSLRSDCAHCASPLSMLDMRQAEALVTQLREADQPRAAVDPSLPLQLARARREVEGSFRAMERDAVWFEDASTSGLVGAGLSAVARWLAKQR